jgi:hypothetical protein
MGVKDLYYGSAIELTAEPITGYYFRNWEVTGIEIEPDNLNINTLAFSMPASKVTVTANFVTHVTVTSISGENGNISRVGGIIGEEIYEVLEGSDITYEMLPDVGYQVKEVLVDGISIGNPINYTFNNIMGCHTIEVIFEAENISTPDVPDIPGTPAEKPLPGNGYITQAPDGTGGTGNGTVTDKTLTFSCSPTVKTSDGCFIYLSQICEM